ncbi:hypothetical protein LIER_09707 [Lithospermum erythrorhizon]|uniref:ATP-dependent DNA helicase n=1 Tax=Lithospermum erythrorhizon TaxID=34254 RepID=A0AAV3PGK9_LITER
MANKVFDGNFRQVLPVVWGGSRSQQINASLVSSDIWCHLIKISLTVNMRAHDDPGFIDFLMRIGNGEEATDDTG